MIMVLRRDKVEVRIIKVWFKVVFLMVLKFSVVGVFIVGVVIVNMLLIF